MYIEVSEGRGDKEGHLLMISKSETRHIREYLFGRGDINTIKARIKASLGSGFGMAKVGRWWFCDGCG